MLQSGAFAAGASAVSLPTPGGDSPACILVARVCRKALALCCVLFTLCALAAPVELAYAGDTSRLMGTIEFKGNLKNLADWKKVLERNAQHPIFTPGSKLNAKTTWDQFKEELLAKKTPLEQIKAVNTFWNRWPYRTDMSVYKINDYWAAPYEFRKNSGDCEDYSIAKYFTLKEIGFDPDKMRIVIVRETIRNLVHAVLAVYLDDDIYILDNLSASVLSHTRLRQYVPQYSLNEKYRWAHVRPANPAGGKR